MKILKHATSQVARGFGPQQISNLETGARPGERKALEEPAMQAPRDGERRPCPSPQENEEGLFMVTYCQLNQTYTGAMLFVVLRLPMNAPH